MPVESVRELIVAEIARTVGTVTSAQGYEMDLQRVHRRWRSPTAETELPYACVVDESEEKFTGSDGAPLRFYLCRLRVSVMLWMPLDWANDEAASTRCNRALADLEKAILGRAALRGGGAGSRVNWTHLAGNETVFPGEGVPFGGVLLRLLVEYLHRDDDPDTGR